MLCARRELKQKFQLTNLTRSHAWSYKTSRPKLDYVGFNSQEVGNASKVFRWDPCRAFRDEFVGLRWRQRWQFGAPTRILFFGEAPLLLNERHSAGQPRRSSWSLRPDRPHRPATPGAPGFPGGH